MLSKHCDDLITRVVSTADEIWRLRSFQALRYQDAGLIESAVEALSAVDPFVDQSTYFGSYSPDGKPVGTCRVIAAPNDELPVFNDFEIYPEVQKALMDNDREVVEVSRVAVATDVAHFDVLASLIRQMVREMVAPGKHSICVAAVEPSLIRIFSQVFDMPCVVVGPMRENYYATDNYPVMIDMMRYLNQRSHRSTRMWQWFTSELVIDLTDSARAPLGVEPMPKAI